MIEENNINRLIFVIDTDTYAGNFERQLCAYITGVIGECEQGDREAEEFRKEHPDLVEQMEYELIRQVPDDHGCRRPVSIYPTPGFFNDGVGNVYPMERVGDPEVTEKYRQELKKYNDKNPSDFEDWETEMPGQHPAYHSVAVFLYEKPSDEILELMVKRAKEYVAGGVGYKRRQKAKITGIRLLEQTVQVKELKTFRI